MAPALPRNCALAATAHAGAVNRRCFRSSMLRHLNTSKPSSRDSANTRAAKPLPAITLAALLNDAAVKSLADYYSHQAATRGAAGDATLMAKGQEVFQHGVPDQGVPACASCHGAQAQGAGTSPRLAGQHKEHLLRQIEVFKNGTRGNAPVMSAVAHTLNDDQAKAVAAYLQSR